MPSRLVIWLLCGAALAVACGPRSHRSESAASTTDAHHSSHRAPKLDRGRELVTTADVSVDGNVSFSLHVTNISDRAVELTFPNGQTHEFLVLDDSGRVVWRWSDGRIFTQSLQNRTLGSSETVTYAERWRGAPSSGHYTVVARLSSSNRPVEQRLAFVLP